MSSYNDIKVLIESYEKFDTIKKGLDKISNAEKCRILSFSSEYDRFDIVNYILDQFVKENVISSMSEKNEFNDILNESYKKYLFLTLNLIRPYISEKNNLELLLYVFNKTLNSCFDQKTWDSIDLTSFDKYMSEYKDIMKELPNETKIKMVKKISELNDSDGQFFNNDFYEFLDKIKSDYNDYSNDNKKEMNRLFIFAIMRHDMEKKKPFINYFKKFLYTDDFFTDNEFAYLNKLIKRNNVSSLTPFGSINLENEKKLLCSFKEQMIKIKPFLKNIDSIDYMINNKELIIEKIKEQPKFEKIKDDVNDIFVYLQDLKKQMILENKTKKLSFKK